MKKKLIELRPYIIILVIVILIRTFIVSPVRVNGGSMDDTLHEGDILILEKIRTNYKLHDIVVVNTKKLTDPVIKRIMAIPGDTVSIENGSLYINKKKVNDPYNNYFMEDYEEIKLDDDQYFVLGDNRKISLDSRVIGPIKEKEIEGIVNIRVWPFKSIEE